MSKSIVEQIYLARAEYYHDHLIMPNMLRIGINVYVEMIKEYAPIHNGHIAGMEVIYNTFNDDVIEIGYIKKVNIN